MNDPILFFRSESQTTVSAARPASPPLEVRALATHPVKQSALSVLAPIRASELADLEKTLGDVGRASMNDPKIGFTNVSTLHFLRWVILPPAEKGGTSTLALETNFDGELDAHLDELMRESGHVFKDVYARCEGLAAGATPRDVADYLRRHSVEVNTFYVGYPGLTAKAIQNDIKLRRCIEKFLQVRQASGPWPSDPLALRAEIQRELAKHPHIYTGHVDRGLPTRGDFLELLIPAGLAALALAPVLVPAAAIWAVLLRAHEERDRKDAEANHYWENAAGLAEKIKFLEQNESLGVINELTHLVELKPGLLRRFTLSNVFRVLAVFAHYIYNNGNLGGIPSIHFARWSIIEDGKRLLFFSNFDGSWESYLGDFIDKAHTGLTAVWSNTIQFPPARWLIEEGATNADAFKRWTRHHQVRTNVWYSAYPTVTLQNVTNNHLIREGLNGDMSAADALKWLSLL
ncbi:hypothetical protein [Sorangium sp. So ce131]|uniref:hypothetical protein n=1 Tax=Sorangium sp. So ce131 TaxID=3133282 RepID=UPI003F5EBCD0